MRTFTYLAFVLVIFLWGQAEAQGLERPDAFGVTPSEAFRYVFSGLMAVLIWIARGTDARIKNLEAKHEKQAVGALNRESRLAQAEKQIISLDNDHKNTLSIVMMQRELLLTKYHDKEDTEKHREKIENLLDRHHDLLTKICTRLDDLSRTDHGAHSRWTDPHAKD